ncbi:hypothetical protein [Alcaligenes sp. 13f]|nr:hypothetical protein [Alcaligenes sp. 13f]
MLSINEWVHVILIGVGATIFMDIWGLIQRALGRAFAAWPDRTQQYRQG